MDILDEFKVGFSPTYIFQYDQQNGCYSVNLFFCVCVALRQCLTILVLHDFNLLIGYMKWFSQSEIVLLSNLENSGE